MPQLQAMSSSHDKLIVAAKPDIPVCPVCRCVMSIRQVTSSTSMIGVSETVYDCEACGTEAHRAAKHG
jgi:hypothetical protein